jgi:hypothetical protein
MNWIRDIKVWQFYLLEFLVIGVLVIVLGSYAHCATMTKKHGDSVGFVMQQTNPNTYIEGAVTNVSLIDKGINLRIQPRGMYSLFTQEILFCDAGQVMALFEGKGGLVTLTYETVAHRAIEEVGCHELRAVDEVKTTPLP